MKRKVYFYLRKSAKSMILKWILLFCIKLDLFASSAKAGVPGIKIKPSANLDDTTEYPELYAVIGSTVFLPCNLTPPSADDAILLVLWYRLDLPNPIYTLDSRGSSLGAKHFSSRILGSRAHFNATRRSAAHLKLDPVEDSDEGEYRCRIDYKRGRTLNRLVKLNVIVPVKKVLIKGIGNITYSGFIGPFTEGEKLTLICEAIGGRPSPLVVWKKGSRILQGSISVAETGDIINELVFDRLKREDVLSVLVCQSTNNNLTASVSASVTIDLNLNPLSIQITTLPSTLMAGDTLELNCQSEGSKPPARITWTKGTEIISHLAIHNVYGSISVSSLTMKVTTEDNGKKLTCRAQNPHLPQSALHNSLNLNVQFAPLLTLVFGASVQYEHIREGSDVYFECNIHSNPPVTDVRWKFYSNVLEHSPLNGIVVRNHSLLLHNVNRRNKGTYQCVAENTLGEGSSEEVLLRIQHSPVCSSLQQLTYGIPRNGKNNITCLVEADPPDVTFKWQINHTGIIRELKGSAILLSLDGGMKSVIEYHPKTKMDYGTVLCHARNAIGTMREPCVFNVVLAGPHAPLHDCAVSNQTTTSLLVSCDYDESSKQTTFHLEIYDMKGEQLLVNLTSRHEPTFFAWNLPIGSTFIVAIYSTGSRGERSETVAMTANTLLSSERHTDSEKGNSINGVVITLLAVLIALAVLAVVSGVIVFRTKTASASLNAATTDAEIIEKLPNTEKHCFEEGAYIYHSSDVPKEFVHLTPKSSSDCMYGSLMDGHGNNFETVLYKAHSLSEEGMEVILPVIDR